MPLKRPSRLAFVAGARYRTRAMSGPVTLEGWYVLHRMYALDWPRWGALAAGEREEAVSEATTVLEAVRPSPRGAERLLDTPHAQG